MMKELLKEDAVWRLLSDSGYKNIYFLYALYKHDLKSATSSHDSLKIFNLIGIKCYDRSPIHAIVVSTTRSRH